MDLINLFFALYSTLGPVLALTRAATLIHHLAVQTFLTWSHFHTLHSGAMTPDNCIEMIWVESISCSHGFSKHGKEGDFHSFLSVWP